MAVKYIKKVEIYVIYVKHCQVLQITPIFIASSMEDNAENGS